jgi:hypothetical protein
MARSFFMPRRRKGTAPFTTSSPEYAEQERCEKDDDEDEEQDLCNFSRAGGNATEAEERCNERDDEEDDSVSKHEALHRVDYRFNARAG